MIIKSIRRNNAERAMGEYLHKEAVIRVHKFGVTKSDKPYVEVSILKLEHGKRRQIMKERLYEDDIVKLDFDVKVDLS